MNELQSKVKWKKKGDSRNEFKVKTFVDKNANLTGETFFKCEYMFNIFIFQFSVRRTKTTLIPLKMKRIIQEN